MTDTMTAPAPAGIEVGAMVITWDDDRPVQYGGPNGDGWSTLTYDLLSGKTPVRKCDPKHVAPADVKIPEKDSRVTVVKFDKALAPYGAQGIWALSVTGLGGRTWHRTKRDGTATGLRMAAIHDWHADRQEDQAAGEGTVTITLPTTGYIILHEIARDGREPYTVPTFIDSAGVMDDEAAKAHVTAEFTALAEHGPANILHKLLLVHRTADGDREIHAPLSVRGAGDPLAD